MKLTEVFDQLTYGEFSQLSIGGQEAGVINESNQNRVVAFIQLGLTALYKRFNLKEGRLTFPLVAGADSYALDLPDLIRVEKVLVDSGVELSLNDYSDAYGVFTPSMKTLRLAEALMAQSMETPEQLKTSNLTVVYRADHPKLMSSTGFLIAETKTLELPDTHLEALLYFVASRANNPMGMTNEFHAGNTWFKKYEMECQRLEADGFEIQEAPQDTRFHDRGFV